MNRVSKCMAVAALVLASAVQAGDCGNGGLFARRAERRAARCSSCQQSASATMESVQPAEIRTTNTYRTTKVAEKVVITPTGPSQAVAPKGGKQ